MLTTKRKPASAGGILIEEFMQPMALKQGALAEAMGVQRKHVNELCTRRRNVTVPTALILARVFGASPDFWLNISDVAMCGKHCTHPANGHESNGPNL